MTLRADIRQAEVNSSARPETGMAESMKSGDSGVLGPMFTTLKCANHLNA